MRESVTIIGSGNVATHMAKGLAGHFDIACIASRTEENARALAKTVGAKFHTTDLSAIPDGCSLYLIAVNDDRISEVAVSTPGFPGVWAHTSGSVGMEVFQGVKRRYGVFYPLQTFSRNASVEMREVPMLIEGNDPETEKILSGIASTISDKVVPADSAIRERIHLAAVFACNFANLMWMEADRLLREAEAGDISLFKPLLQQTLGKLNELSPYDAMTGPARRGDMKIITKHLERLQPEQREIYSLLTDRILKTFHKTHI